MTSDEYKELSLREFDKAAEHFDDNSPSVYNICRNDYPDIIAELKKEDWESLLDAGCGTGALMSLIRKDFPKRHYTGIDMSEKMLEIARKNNESATLVHGDCEALPFEKGSFDVVICTQSFHHYPNPDKFFESVSRVLKPNGRLILRDMTAKSGGMRWFINHIELPLVNVLAKKGDVSVYSKEEIESFCNASGLTLESFEYKKGFRLHSVCRKK